MKRTSQSWGVYSPAHGMLLIRGSRDEARTFVKYEPGRYVARVTMMWDEPDRDAKRDAKRRKKP